MPFRLWIVALLFMASAATASAQTEAWYKQAVKSVEATFDPATAAPGQTVAVKLTVKLNEGFHTYPTVQPDKAAASYVNKITFPDTAGVIFVGEVAEPGDPLKKAEPLLGIKELRMHPGTVAYTRKAVVSPKAAAGAMTSTLTFRLSVCDADNCYNPKTLKPEAKLTVAGNAVAVEKAFAADVEKALAGK